VHLEKQECKSALQFGVHTFEMHSLQFCMPIWTWCSFTGSTNLLQSWSQCTDWDIFLVFH